ncbi:MAG: uroporphyrinogen-III C-methyltransferase [Planctomycetaceae bacterium]|nr:uroporphyrinogen-III C-methyltransferase [Planctomycetaceae bacterium]
MSSSTDVARVYLVGAGPGDPGLISLRAVECLRIADLVLYDGLVNPLLLRHTNAVCERTARTRRDGSGIVPQEEVNQRLVCEAQAGRTVVRLKGGDPCIFGRGSEEADALEAAGIPFEIVPGITAATAAAEYAGFSFTHRRISSAVAFITGHEDPTRSDSRLDFDAISRFPGTLVFYMGLSRLPEICRQLITSGMPADTAAAIVCQASLPSQRVATGTLSTLPEVATAAGLKPPSLIVVGECVTQRERHSWFELLPLFGQSIAITRPVQQAGDIVDQVVRLGGEPVLMPMIEIKPVDDSTSREIARRLQSLLDVDWLIFTSVNGVGEFFRHLWMSGKDSRAIGHCSVAAIGTSTAEALAERGIRADIVPQTFRAEALADALAPVVGGKKVLWVRANRGRDILPTALKQAGASVEDLVVYQNNDCQAMSPDISQRLRDGTLNWIALSSPSIAKQFLRMLQEAGMNANQLRAKIATISPVTTAAVQSAGMNVAVEAGTHTWAGMIRSICEYQREE